MSEKIRHNRSAEEIKLETSKAHYENAAHTLGKVAEQIMGLSLPEDTINNWRVLLGAVRIIDDRLDSIPGEQERKVFAIELKKFLNGEEVNFSYDQKLEKAMWDVKGLMDDLPEDRRRSFISSISIVLRVTEKIKTEEDPSDFTDLTRLEGQVFTRSLFPFLPEEFRKSDKYQTLVKILTRLGRAANTFDTFVDLGEDYQKGRTRTEPSIGTRFLLFGATASDSLSFLREMKLSPKLVIDFAKGVRDTMLKSSE